MHIINSLLCRQKKDLTLAHWIEPHRNAVTQVAVKVIAGVRGLPSLTICAVGHWTWEKGRREVIYEDIGNPSGCIQPDTRRHYGILPLE